MKTDPALSPVGTEPRRNKDFPEYVPPRITTISSQDIMKRIGPAQACTSAPVGPE